MSNLFVRFKKLVQPAPERVGSVTAVSGTALTVLEDGGGVVRVTGSATVGQRVYFRNHTMMSLAPTLAAVSVTE